MPAGVAAPNGQWLVQAPGDGTAALRLSREPAPTGNLPAVEHVMEAGMTLMPMIGKARVLRSWGGIVDMTGDRSPILSRTPVEGIYVNCGWGTGGFKAIPGSGWAMAELVAQGKVRPAGDVDKPGNAFSNNGKPRKPSA